MKRPSFENQFKKELNIAEKRGKDLTKIKAIMFDLICENPLPSKNKDHELKGQYKQYRECHVEPDWLLIYKATPNEIIFARTGTHSDLF